MSHMRLLLIGGIGGSGTRVVANIMHELGIYVGSNLNPAFDNLDWPVHRELLLDKSKSDQDKLLSLAADFKSFAHHMVCGAEAAGKTGPFWATKVPGSYYYLPYLSQLFDNLHYIHVIRHGLDMAFSYNHNQLWNWGSFFDLAPIEDDLPKFLLKYWIQANSYALEQCNTFLQDRHMLIRLEDLCSDTENSIRRILNFVGKDAPGDSINELTKLIRTPETIGRYKHLGRPEMFDSGDLETVKEFGYKVEF